MNTNYDAIAADYKRAKQQPWRYFVERYTMLQLIGSLEGLSVLDLACGEGYYTREYRQRGAVRAVGVDLSTGMIQLARKQEEHHPLGIEYVVSDASAFDGAGSFDLVAAAYLLNYASNREELTAMCTAVARALRPGGRFVTVNNNPAQEPEYYDATRKYGFVKSATGEVREGSPIICTILQDGGPLNLTNYWLSPEVHEECMRAAGLRDIRWHNPRVSTLGKIGFDAEYWEALLNHPPVIFLECAR
jgi:ubiquinone/menaquinone biosynthesis C-methylase UbiE